MSNDHISRHISRQDLERTRSLEALDLVQRSAPFCSTCGAPTVPVARGAILRLECPAVASGAPTFMERLRNALGPAHTRRTVLDAAA